MSRHANRRSAHVQQDAPASATAVAGAEAPQAAPAAVEAPGINWTWRVVLFLWLTAFAFLCLYEGLQAVVRTAARMF